MVRTGRHRVGQEQDARRVTPAPLPPPKQNQSHNKAHHLNRASHSPCPPGERKEACDMKWWIMWYGERLWVTASSERQAVNYLRRRVRAAPYNCPARLAKSLVDRAYRG